MKNQEQALVAADGRAGTISPQIIENVVRISDRDCKWLKFTEAGFFHGKNLLTEQLRGVIFDIRPYFIQWKTGEPPKKIPFTRIDDQPEGFELRVDLKISLMDKELIALSLAPSSARSFSRYMRRLQSLQFAIVKVVTIIHPRAVSNKAKQKFTILDFDVIPPDPASRELRWTKSQDPNEPPPVAMDLELERASNRPEADDSF